MVTCTLRRAVIQNRSLRTVLGVCKALRENRFLNCLFCEVRKYNETGSPRIRSSSPIAAIRSPPMSKVYLARCRGILGTFAANVEESEDCWPKMAKFCTAWDARRKVGTCECLHPEKHNRNSVVPLTIFGCQFFAHKCFQNLRRSDLSRSPLFRSLQD